jgi:glucokinase
MAPPPSAEVALGFDIGGTRLKTITLDGDRVVSSSVRPVPPTLDELLDALLLTTEEVTAEGITVEAIGIALPGLVDPAFGARSLPGKLPGLGGYNLVSVLGAATTTRVACLNDGAAAAFGEWALGAGRGVEDLAVLTLGTGVGSGVILNGSLLESEHLGTGGGLGHLTIDPTGQICLCGNRGCAETMISAVAVATSVQAYIARGVATVLADEGLSGTAVRFERVVEAAMSGDRVARTVVETVTNALGATVVSAVQIFALDTVVLVGGMVADLLPILPEVARYVDAHAWRYPPDRRIRILPGELGDYAGAAGAAAYARDAERSTLIASSG